MSTSPPEANSGDNTPSEEETCVIHACRTQEEAQGIASFLKDQGQTFIMRTLKDSAYPGIVDRGRDWGEIRVPLSEKDQAKQLIDAWLSAEPIDDLEDASTSAAYPAIQESATRGIPWPFFIIALLFAAAAVAASDCL